MRTVDFAAFNEEVRQVWDSFNAGRPVRVPVTLLVGPRIWLQNPAINTEGITWEAFSNDPELMFQTYLKYQHYLRHHVPHDIEMGIPKVWPAWTEFVNITEPVWLGCGLHYPENQTPVTDHAYMGDRKNAVFDLGMPGPFDGVMGKVREYHEHFVSQAKGFEFHGRPVEAQPPCTLGTDGLLTVAFDIRGPELLEDILIDPDYFHRLMDFLTTAIISKIKAWRKYLGMPEVTPGQFGTAASRWFADDAIQFLSTAMYVEHILPYHKRFLKELYEGDGPFCMHLCGNVQRHLPTLIRELNVQWFDTGFPINWATLRDEVGENVTIQGGVLIMDLLSKTPAQIREEARKVLQSGILRGKRFMLKEANNLPPCVPEENLWAMHDAAREFGRYQ